MSRNFMLVLWACLVVGCVDHAQQRADNALIAGQYGLALNECADKAIAYRDATHDAAKAGDQYVACAAAADKKFGRK